MQKEIKKSIELLQELNPGLIGKEGKERPGKKLRKVLIANRGEIAKRFFLALKEEGIPSVAVVTEPDRDQSWYEFADEVIHIGEGANYTNIPIIVGAAILTRSNAIYPGYGFLSENHQFVDVISQASADFKHEMQFMGPAAAIMRRVGNKLDARKLAKDNGVSLFEGTVSLTTIEETREAANKIGYPVIVKLNAGGGGKGMTPVFSEKELEEAVESAKRIGATNYKDDSFYLEKFIVNPVHIEVQIFNSVAVGIRKCAAQRRNQKVIEESGDFFLNDHLVLKLLSAAETMSSISGYSAGAGAGTVEFLYDSDSGEFGFLEINTRLQVEYAVTDLALGIDLVKWQIFHFDNRESEIPYHNALRQRFVEKDHAIQCRIYAEDTKNNYAPSPGRIQELDLPTFNGVRCDFGFKKGDEILPDYDPLVGKLITYGKTRGEAIVRMERALSELYIKGITTNVEQLLRIVRHQEFTNGKYTNRLLDQNIELCAGKPEEENSELAAIFGTLSLYGRNLQQAVSECFLTDDLENLLSSERPTQVPRGYLVEINEKSLRIDLIQTSIDSFYSSVNGKHFGEFKIISRLDGTDDFHVFHEGRSFPIRADRRPSHLMLRTLDENNRTIYHRMKVKYLGIGKKSDPAGLVRAPFQGSFVKFAGEAANAKIHIKKGSRVKKGEPVIVISAMKMETTLRSPVDGIVDYLIDDGDLSRLVKSVTKDGLVQGRSLTEGEVLFIVKEAGKKEDADEQSIEEKFSQKKSTNFLDHIFDPDLTNFIKTNPNKHTPVIFQILRVSFLGFYLNGDATKQLQKTIEELGEEFWAEINPNLFEKEIENIISIYTSVKKLFSPALSSNLSFFGELNQLVLNWQDESYRPPYYFREALGQLFKKYGITKWAGKRSNSRIQHSFLFILRAHYMAQNFTDTIRALVWILSCTKKLELSTITSLNRLVLQEQAERDDSLASYARHVLSGKVSADHRTRNTLTVVGLSRKYMNEYKKFILDEFASIPGFTSKECRETAAKSLKNPESALIPTDVPEWVKAAVEKRCAAISKTAKLERLHPYLKNILIFRTTPKETETPDGYLCFSYLEEGCPVLQYGPTGTIIGAENFEVASINSVRVLSAYETVQKLPNNYIEILASETPIDVDLSGRDPKILNYSSINKLSHSVLRFFLHAHVKRLMIDIAIRHPKSGIKSSKQLSISMRNSKLFFDILQPDDKNNPYWNGEENPKNQRLFDRQKWPIEVWANETFDPESCKEILIASIDDATDKEGKKTSVGARIYRGTIDGNPALFFMKDSRVAGGATGDLEGRKFLASAYIAYRSDTPLYVWNDGAGANIKQGMVSLNRAAEGFMMNTLLAHRVSPEEFNRYTSGCEDPVIRELFKELDKTISFNSNVAQPRSLFLSAIGIGSSTGLDVYGSSQANIQAMIDAEDSYRVLTGSAVIKAVTGEELTNYKIGGARVMENWTGTVDMVARNKIDLIKQIRHIHDIFSHETQEDSIRRVSLPPSEDPGSESNINVVSEGMIAGNTDNGEFLHFKDNYYGSRSLIGGFAKLGGRRVLLMGPRTQLGIRSLASVLKARELLGIAKNTGSAQILLFGKRWYYSLEAEDDLAIRARMDWIQSLHEKKGPRIHIITHPQGLRKVTLNAAADAIIFVKTEIKNNEELKFCKKVSTFVVETLEEAFDLSQKIISLISPIDRPVITGEIQPEGFPEIPTDFSKPFDMIQSVINTVVDKNSFLEFYREMNDPAGGPTLVTGLARLNGTTVGIIADQPAEGGAPDAPGTEKFRFFTEFLNKNNLPIMMLSNAPGFVPGTKQERLRIQQIGAFSLDANILGHAPVISVVLNQNYGGRQIHAFSKFLRPGISYIALKEGQLAVMGASAAFDLFQGAKYAALIEEGKEAEATKLRDIFIKDYQEKASAKNDAMKTGVLDWTVDSNKDLRENIIKGLELATKRSVECFDWKR